MLLKRDYWYMENNDEIERLEGEILELKEKQVTSHHPGQNSHCVATWNIVAKKPF